MNREKSEKSTKKQAVFYDQYILASPMLSENKLDLEQKTNLALKRKKMKMLMAMKWKMKDDFNQKLCIHSGFQENKKI